VARRRIPRDPRPEDAQAGVAGPVMVPAFTSHLLFQSTQRQKGCPAGSRNTRNDVPG
jgi:hypothetical protein